MSLDVVLTLMIWLTDIPRFDAEGRGLLHMADARTPQLFAPGAGEAELRKPRELAGDGPGTSVVNESADPLFTRVRSTERYMIVLIREGYDRSATFRKLVDTLQQSNVIVFVQPGYCAGGRIRSCLVSLDGSQRERHIRIKVDPQHTIHDRLIATIAHELEHAVEIAEQPTVIDASGALKLYRQIALGRCRRGLSDECETQRALTAEKKVLKELFQAASEEVTATATPLPWLSTTSTAAGSHLDVMGLPAQ